MEKDYCDPKVNPFIRVAVPDDDGDDTTLLTDPYHTGMPPILTARDESDVLSGLDTGTLKDFIGGEAAVYVYPARFYEAGVTAEELMTLPPRLVLTRDGDRVKIAHPFDDDVMTAEEADLLRIAIRHKAAKRGG